MKKAAFYLSLVLVALVLVTGTGLQAISFIIISILTYINAYTKKDVKPLILVICIVMFLINAFAPISLIDMVAWVILGILSYGK
jgi:hypothetical protein